MSLRKWFLYSGASVSVTLNPLHWRWRPWSQRDWVEWAGPNEHSWSCGFLFLTIRIWVDDGSW